MTPPCPLPEEFGFLRVERRRVWLERIRFVGRNGILFVVEFGVIDVYVNV